MMFSTFFFKSSLVVSISIFLAACNVATTPQKPNTATSSSTSSVSTKTDTATPVAAVPIPKEFISGINTWYPRIYHHIARDFEFIRVMPDNPVALNLESASSLDKLRQPIFWGYGVRHIPTQKILPVYGQIEGRGEDPFTGDLQPVRYRGYFKLHKFRPNNKGESVNAVLSSVSLSGFAGERQFMGENHFVVSNLIANAHQCSWQHNFWNSSQRLWGINYNRLLSFHARVGRSHNENGQQWQVYTQMPRQLILDLQTPDMQILKNLISSIGELPKVRYQQYSKYASDYVVCNLAHAHSGKSVGSKQHRYSLFYPRLRQFGKLAPIDSSFRYKRTPGLLPGAKLSIGTKAGGLSKFLLMGHYEPWLAHNPKSLPIASFTVFGTDMLYAVGPNNQLELWHVDPKTPTKDIKTRLFRSSGHKVKNRFPINANDLNSLALEGYLDQCDEQKVLVGACDGSRFPTVLKSNRGEQMEVWYTAEDRWLHSWNPSTKKVEVSQLAPLSAGSESIAASREQFICQQLEDNLAKIDQRLQRQFISDRPYARWYENEVSGFMDNVRYVKRWHHNRTPTDVADDINDRERRGSKELRELWKQASRAQQLASDTYCPETKALAAEYVPMVRELRKEVVTVLNDIWKDVKQQAKDLEYEMYLAEKNKRKREHEAWKRRFHANMLSQLQNTLDITSTVNQITAQTNAMYQNALKVQEAQRKKRQQQIAQINRKREQQKTIVQTQPKPKPKPKQTTKPAYEGFPEQSSFTINVPNALAIDDINNGGGGTHQ